MELTNEQKEAIRNEFTDAKIENGSAMIHFHEVGDSQIGKLSHLHDQYDISANIKRSGTGVTITMAPKRMA